MTTIKKKYTKTEKYTETVKTCDICGLLEEDLPDEESIEEVKGAPEVSTEYYIRYWPFNDYNDYTEKTYEDYREAKDKVRELSNGADYDYKSHTTVEVEYDFEMDACTHCIDTLLSGVL